MKQIQKRYIYSGLISALFFIISYGFLNINLIISFVLTILIYFGGILLFKEKDIRELTPENVDNYYFLASKCANIASRIDDADIKTHIEKIATYTDEIIVSLTQRPKKVEQVFDFFDYYLDITYKILIRYKGILSQTNKTEKDKNFEAKTKDYLTSIESAFEKQLANMKEARMLDIESEIRMFERTFGIKKTDMEVGENDENK